MCWGVRVFRRAGKGNGRGYGRQGCSLEWSIAATRIWLVDVDGWLDSFRARRDCCDCASTRLWRAWSRLFWFFSLPFDACSKANWEGFAVKGFVCLLCRLVANPDWSNWDRAAGSMNSGPNGTTDRDTVAYLGKLIDSVERVMMR